MGEISGMPRGTNVIPMAYDFSIGWRSVDQIRVGWYKNTYGGKTALPE
jgi:hypothetical protein